MKKRTRRPARSDAPNGKLMVYLTQPQIDALIMAANAMLATPGDGDAVGIKPEVIERALDALSKGKR